MAEVIITTGHKMLEGVADLTCIVNFGGDDGYVRFWCPRGWYDPIAYLQTSVHDFAPNIPWLS